MASLLNLPRFKLESNQLHGYLQGVWRRNLEWRSFGGSYQHLQATNSVVVIDNVRKRDEERGDRVSAEEGEGPLLDWSFTHKQNVHEDALIFGYHEVHPGQNETYMEWTHHNSRCHGNFRPVSSLMTLNFFMEDATIIVSYYILILTACPSPLLKLVVLLHPQYSTAICAGYVQKLQVSQIFDAVFSKETTGRKRGHGSPGYCNG